MTDTERFANHQCLSGPELSCFFFFFFFLSFFRIFPTFSSLTIIILMNSTFHKNKKNKNKVLITWVTLWHNRTNYVSLSCNIKSAKGVKLTTTVRSKANICIIHRKKQTFANSINVFIFRPFFKHSIKSKFIVFWLTIIFQFIFAFTWTTVFYGNFQW